jgi:phosphoesterase RecJ-like protein
VIAGTTDGISIPQHESLADIPARAFELRDFILQHERLAIVSHANPDADAVASVLAMRAICEFIGREPVVTVAGDGQVPANLMFLNNVLALTQRADEAIQTADLIIYVDCADMARVGPLYDNAQGYFQNHPASINIDHHVTNQRFGTLNCVAPAAAATSEILEIVRETLEVPIDGHLATAMLAGIYGDTLGLRTPSTSPATMRVAAELLEVGAELDVVVDWLFRVKPYSAVKLWGEALSHTAWSGPLIWTYIDRGMLERTQSSPSEVEGLVNFLAGTVGARAASLAYEESNAWRISLRSVHDDVDVSELAKLYGGGGHPRAAGLRLPGDIEALKVFADAIGGAVSAESNQSESSCADDEES